jgi:hypothetical protein
VSGDIAGFYTDSTHGFVRGADGTITTFDALSASSTVATSINAVESVTGYTFKNMHAHGFLRGPEGTIVNFDAPGAYETFGEGINRSAVIAGYHLDTNNLNHGFTRQP